MFSDTARINCYTSYYHDVSVSGVGPQHVDVFSEVRSDNCIWYSPYSDFLLSQYTLKWSSCVAYFERQPCKIRSKTLFLPVFKLYQHKK